MALSSARKREIVAELADIAARSQAMVVADPTGMSAAQLNALRRRARTQRVALRMAMNTLARRALDGTGHACAKDALRGPSLFAFSMDPDEPGGAARVLRELMPAGRQPVVKLVAIGGQLLGAEHAGRVARLPNRAGALAQLLWALSAPVARLASALSAPAAQWIRALAALAERRR